VIVDTSKNPVYAGFLSGIPGIDLRLAHLVRDPRAVAFSWRRRRLVGTGDREMKRLRPSTSARAWALWNLAAGRVARRRPDMPSAIVRYEDLVARPRPTLEALASLAGEAATELPFMGERTVRIGTHHTASANPRRFATGEIEIREDDEWRRAQGRRDRAVVTVLTSPWLRRYGYPLRVGAETGRREAADARS
jgi:hypothetical protein